MPSSLIPVAFGRRFRTQLCLSGSRACHFGRAPWSLPFRPTPAPMPSCPMAPTPCRCTPKRRSPGRSGATARCCGRHDLGQEWSLAGLPTVGPSRWPANPALGWIGRQPYSDRCRGDGRRLSGSREDDEDEKRAAEAALIVLAREQPQGARRAPCGASQPRWGARVPAAGRGPAACGPTDAPGRVWPETEMAAPGIPDSRRISAAILAGSWGMVTSCSAAHRCSPGALPGRPPRS